MAIPMIRALQYLPDAIVDVLVGDLPDDFGARQVLSKVVGGQGKLYVTEALEHHYDVAVMAIPFDGRWRNGIHFNADQVIDGRTRPDPKTTGLVSWQHHEIDYQMDNARQLGYFGDVPSARFMPYMQRDPDRIYVGVGYKKDASGFWKVKHWGNENYAKLITMILDHDPKIKVVMTGDVADFSLSIAPIKRMVSNQRLIANFSSNIDDAFRTVAGCGTYVGNDTGMMHVASSCGLNVLGLFFMQHAVKKNGPWIDNVTAQAPIRFAYAIDASEHKGFAEPEVVFDTLIKLRRSCTTL